MEQGETFYVARRPRIRKPAGMTLDEFVVREYLPHAKIRKKSWAIDERIARRHISPFFGARPLDSIQANEIEEWHNSLLENGFSAASCNRYLAVLRGILGFGVERGALARSPCCNIAAFKSRGRLERCLSHKEAACLMARLASSDKIEARAIQLLLLTGAKKGEILEARWENVSFERNTLAIGNATHGGQRHIILSEAAASLLKRMSRTRTGPWLFPGRSPGKHISDIYLYWNSLRNELGLANMRIQDLRHSFANFLVNSGRSLYELQKLLGHQHVGATRRYFPHERS